MTVAGYTIAGGEQDAERLAEQARIMEAASMAFLERAGAAPGTACVDVGCGTGQVTLALAEIVGEKGRVVGVDKDDASVGIARAAAAERPGLRVVFVRADAMTLPMRNEFHVAYARLVLSHLIDPLSAIAAMTSAVRPGGVVAIEDMFLGTLHADPAVPALDRLQEIYGATVRAHGGDPTLGPRLPALMAHAELLEIEETTVQNRIETTAGKRFLVQLLDDMRPAILGCGAATEAELDEVRTAVEAAAADPGTVFHQVRMHQVLGRRAGAKRPAAGFA